MKNPDIVDLSDLANEGREYILYVIRHLGFHKGNVYFFIFFFFLLFFFEFNERWVITSEDVSIAVTIIVLILVPILLVPVVVMPQ